MNIKREMRQRQHEEGKLPLNNVHEAEYGTVTTRHPQLGYRDNGTMASIIKEYISNRVHEVAKKVAMVKDFWWAARKQNDLEAPVQRL